MNENWPEIVETLLPYFGVNSAEGDYQREIEICLKFLGWKKTNETMRSQIDSTYRKQQLHTARHRPLEKECKWGAYSRTSH